MTQRAILHVDMDAFFVACEVRRDPTLAGKPVIVGGKPEGRGVVCSASYEARRFGVRSAMASRRAQQLCPEAIFIRGHMGDYVETSRHLRAIFEEMTPLVEMASLDEAYLDLTGTERLWGSPDRAALRLKQRVMEVEGLPCSVGLATTKCVAKIASDHDKPDGFTWVEPGQEKAFLNPLPLRSLPGIGPKTHERLQRWGLKTIGDLARLGSERLTQAFGQHGEDLWIKSIGQAHCEVTPRPERKSIGRETTFETDTGDRAIAMATLSRLAEDVASRLRARGLAAHRVTLKLRDSGFNTITRAITLPMATNFEVDLIDAVGDLLRTHWAPGTHLRLVGLSTSMLVEDRPQLDLLDGPRHEREAKLSRALDSIRERHGSDAIHRASSVLGAGGNTLPPWEIGGRMPDDS